MKSNGPILLVEDDEVDVMTIRRALKLLKVSNPLDVAGNGEEALEYLHNTKASLPCIILLDLNMPRMGGLEFLGIIKQDPILHRIPVIILTSSRQEQDRIASFDKNIAGYMVKPVSDEQFVEVVRTINLYWTLSEMPVDVEAEVEDD
ncbi:MAG: response regulator [Chloroflexota bacterium]